MTVDKSHVLVSNGWDRHLAYVAMSRHKDDLQLYLGKEQFEKFSVDKTISQARVQESAVEFAQRHAIDIKEEDGSIVLLDQPAVTKQEKSTDQSATDILNKGLIPEAFRHYETNGRVTAEATTQPVSYTHPEPTRPY